MNAEARGDAIQDIRRITVGEITLRPSSGTKLVDNISLLVITSDTAGRNDGYDDGSVEDMITGVIAANMASASRGFKEASS